MPTFQEDWGPNPAGVGSRDMHREPLLPTTPHPQRCWAASLILSPRHCAHRLRQPVPSTSRSRCLGVAAWQRPGAARCCPPALGLLPSPGQQQGCKAQTVADGTAGSVPPGELCCEHLLGKDTFIHPFSAEGTEVVVVRSGLEQSSKAHLEWLQPPQPHTATLVLSPQP